MFLVFRSESIRATLLFLSLGAAFALAVEGAQADLFINSSEPICDSGDPTILWCDDFEDGSYIETCEAGGHSCCQNPVCQANGAGLANPNNDGWLGNAYTSWPDPQGTAWARCGGVGASSNCAATSGVLKFNPNGEGGVMGRKKFPNGREYGEVYVRWYTKELPGFSRGHEKMMTLENNSGNYRPAILVKLFGGACPVMNNKVSDELYHQNIGEKGCLVNNHWHYIEMRVNVVDGIYELWMDDCGPDGTACNGIAGTKRARYTGLNFGSGRIGATWLENWSNASSTGEQYYDQFVVSTRRIGPMGSSQQAPPQPPPSPILLD